MKTFKMLSFELQLDGKLKKIPLTDGIIISQENSHQLWVIEAFTTSEYKELFDELILSGTMLDARVIISFPDNEPAPFSIIAHSLTPIDQNISVLFKGRLKAQRKKYAELLLSQLLEQGLRNDELLVAFEQGMRERPSLQERNERLENTQVIK
ncbi:YwpF-like family protein [Solibacillus sp. MA9]|uniref:YwpF-like family protein n=1 Tax=Solibacillus palustris TaxID=2908203 RepID=A0ABS9U8C9_9BACL|nr:YwpF-like family protein [Solibacillus sp. MA9]MCH7320587.1 YwpF-like family protein [Solibacillus sp. MA9]